MKSCRQPIRFFLHPSSFILPHPMPYDPTFPADHAPLSAADMRVQLNAIQAQLDNQAMSIAGLSGQIAGLLAQISAVTAGSSSNSDAVANLNLTLANDPPRQWE